MRFVPKFAFLGALLMASGCYQTRYVPPESQLPPNTVLLSQMMRELSEQPSFTDDMLAELKKASKTGAAVLTPALLDKLRSNILGKNFVGLDRFPGWSMHEIDPIVRVAGHVAGNNTEAENLSAVHPGAPPAPPVHDLLDIGPYALNKPETLSLSTPSSFPAFTTEGIVTQLRPEVVRGDGPNDLAPEHPESQRLAYVLNRLAANKLDGSRLFIAALDPIPPNTNISSAESPEQLINILQQTGHEVVVTDSRYFANFGHFHYKNKDVMMPFWVDSQLIVPHSGGRPLFIPVSHAEYEWRIRGPVINADISYYFGVDGKSQWRTMDTLDQAWVLKRNAHTYYGAQAAEVTRLTGLMTVAYMHLHAAHPTLPFGGYYPLGVCQDGVSAIEQHMTGHVTLFPNTVDMSFFNDPRDIEINSLFAKIPKDRDDAEPEPERIFGSLPADPGPNATFSTITIPGLADDLHDVYVGWTKGELHRSRSRLHTAFNIALITIVSLGILGAIAISTLRRRNMNMEDEF